MTEKKNAYLTVYVCLMLTVLLSVYLLLIEEVRYNGACLEALCAAEAGMQSIQAEYHRELADRYGIYAIDSSYGAETCGRNRTEAHLMWYVEKNLNTEDVFLSGWFYRDFFGLHPYDAELSGVCILTDQGGAEFRRQAIETVKSDVGWDVFRILQQRLQVIKVNGLDTTDITAQREQLEETLKEYGVVAETVNETKQTDSFAKKVADGLWKKPGKGVLALVTDEQTDLSAKHLELTGLYSDRKEQGILSTGNLAAQDSEGIFERFLFREYIVRSFGNYLHGKEDGALSYQTEFVIAGKDSDIANLKSVVNRIFLIRGAANTLYLLNNEEKKAQVEAAASLVALLCKQPKSKDVIQALIVNIWASAESIYDVKTLLQGGEVPLLKDDDSWHYSLEQVFGGGEEQEEDSGGLSYEDYLRILLMFEGNEKVTDRTMDMVEAEIRFTPRNSFFRLDACYGAFEAQVRMRDFKDIEYEVVRQKQYR